MYIYILTHKNQQPYRSSSNISKSCPILKYMHVGLAWFLLQKIVWIYLHKIISIYTKV